MSKLLLDTNFIVAAILPNDELHERAVKLEIKENLTVSNECYVSNQIVSGVMNILGQKDSVEVAKNTYNMMKDNFIWINEYEIPDFNDSVLSTYKRLNRRRDKDLKAKHKLGFTDCSIITTAKLFSLDSIVSFDENFLRNDMVDIIY
ncbi:MAG: type II toxin-antitoxin system VapC family toxin [Methanobrevibacter ruminantium]|uniref:type II toxin-antitoxin system VapC family toxin n=1 Tax=Methanobrevibacter ruminantium TaxID=83816 RepID=UPI0026F254DB|nr:type II toxin-antitoxin system VapC family toxin [Methanobrevibacter ruminantium]MDD6049255.1 type II toxin-antitoxin system VapC family toxin [Methanobrevibacter ruminantium]